MAIPESSGTIEILHQDESVVIIDKPPAMLTHVHNMDRHAPNVQGVLERRLVRPVHVVHRLDRMTTGAMVIALNREAAHHLSVQFRERTISKRYLAIVRGHTEEEGLLTNPLEAASGQVEATTSFLTLGHGTVHEAVGRYTEAWFSLLELRLHTGRRHQARRHLHQINHPVLGDNRHGDKVHNRWAADRFGIRHLYLRASELAFVHPDSGRQFRVTLALPDLWRKVAPVLGIDLPPSLPHVSEVEILT